MSPTIANLQTQIIDSLQHIHSQAQDKIVHNDILQKILTPEQLNTFTSPPYFIGMLVLLSSIIYWLSSSGKSDATKRGGKKNSKSKKKAKKNKKSKKPVIVETPEQKFSRVLQGILTKVETELSVKVDEFEDALKKYKESKCEAGEQDPKAKDQLNYSYLYLEETLLKELMKLDELEHNGDEELRLQRKKAINYVQGLHKKIDLLKKEYFD